MQLKQIATFHSPFGTKFGIPKQAGLATNLQGVIEFCDEYRNADYLRGIESFDYLWLLWGFSANKHAANSPLVRPPLLGGNERMGVFATRSPFRPNPIGLSSVRLGSVEFDNPHGPVLNVLGADLMDGTPIYDIKPYIVYADAHPDAPSGFVDTHALHRLVVNIGAEVAKELTDAQIANLKDVLALDPRPHYHSDPNKVYGMMFDGYDIHFSVDNDTLYVIDCLNPNRSLDRI